MEVWKNKVSGKYFIFLRDEAEEIVLITPLGEIKTLDSNKFEGPFNIAKTDLIVGSLLSEEQVSKWEKYICDLEGKKSELMRYSFKNTDLDTLITDLEGLITKGGSEEDTFEMLRKNYPDLGRRAGSPIKRPSSREKISPVQR